jgi:hypothetical protein
MRTDSSSTSPAKNAAALQGGAGKRRSATAYAIPSAGTSTSASGSQLHEYGSIRLR